MYLYLEELWSFFHMVAVNVFITDIRKSPESDQNICFLHAENVHHITKLILYFPPSVSFDKFQSSVLLVKTKIQLQNRLNKSLANLWPA